MDTRDYTEGNPLPYCLDPALVCYPAAREKHAVLRELVRCLEHVKHLSQEMSAQILQAVEDREKLVSTGIGVGVALPHAKLIDCPNFFVVIGILPQGIDWQALDGTPVRLVFLVVGPDNRQSTYLKILSQLTYALKEDEKRKKLLNLSSQEEIVRVFY